VSDCSCEHPTDTYRNTKEKINRVKTLDIQHSLSVVIREDKSSLDSLGSHTSNFLLYNQNANY
jgi:hypothetical protein